METQGLLKGRRILVTGASGYVGSWLAEYALRDGADVRVLLRLIPPHLVAWSRKFQVTIGDLMDPASLGQACRDREIVWHAASANETICNKDLSRAVAINVTGLVNMMEQALARKVGLFIKLSTFHVYGASGREAIDENTPPVPVSAYGLTNLMGDEVAQYYRKARGLKLIIPRLSNGYGAPLFREVDRWSLIVNNLSRMAYEKQRVELTSSGLAQRDFIALRDVYRALKLLSTRATDDAVINVGGGCSLTLRMVAERVKKIYDRRYHADIRLTTAPAATGETSQPVRYDITRLKKLGFTTSDVMDQEIDAIFSLLEGTCHDR